MMASGSEGGFVFEEIKGDLFSCPVTNSLAHCVSRDLAMGKGIAVQFKKDFGQVENLKRQDKRVGQVAKLKISSVGAQGQTQTRSIYYMITKERSTHKPTLQSMERTLKSLREEAIKDGVETLSMPRIGCGLDKLQWEDVKKLICEVFKNTSIKINVYVM